MSFIDRRMLDTATWWEIRTNSPYNEFGDPTFKSNAPILLAPTEGNGVWWEYKTEKIILSTGEVLNVKAHVWSATTPFEVGDYLFSGVSTSTDPETVTGADQILKVEILRDTHLRKTIYKAFL